MQQVNQIEATSPADMRAAPRRFPGAAAGANAFGFARDPFPCCTANFNQGWPKLAASIFWTTADGGLAVGLLFPATARLPNGVGGGGRVSVETW